MTRGIQYSIIVPVSRERELLKLVRSIETQDYDLSYVELVLVYDTPKEELTSDYVRIVSAVSTRPHPAAKRNLGAQIAGGHYLVFLDDDVALPSDWLRNATSILADNANSILNGPDFNQEEGWLAYLAEVLKNHPLAEGTGNRTPATDKEVSFLSVSLCNVVLSKELFTKLGGFNSDIHFTLDDTEFFFLAQLSNVTLLKSPRLSIEHKRPRLIVPYLKHRAQRRFWVGYHTLLFPQMFMRTNAFRLMMVSWLVLPLATWLIFVRPIEVLALFSTLHIALTLLTNVKHIGKIPGLVFCLPIAFLSVQAISWMAYTIGLLKGLLECRALYKLRASQFPRWEKASHEVG